LAAKVAELGPRMVGLSVTLPTNVAPMREAIARMRAACPSVKILVGGRATPPDVASSLGADAFARCGSEAVEVARGWRCARPTVARRPGPGSARPAGDRGPRRPRPGSELRRPHAVRTPPRRSGARVDLRRPLPRQAPRVPGRVGPGKHSGARGAARST